MDVEHDAAHAAQGIRHEVERRFDQRSGERRWREAGGRQPLGGLDPVRIGLRLRLSGPHQRLKRVHDGRSLEDAQVVQVVGTECRHSERWQHAEAGQLREDARPVPPDRPVGRVVDEGVVVLGLHVLALDELERALRIETVPGVSHHHVGADGEAGRGIVERAEDGVRLEVPAGLQQHLDLGLAVLVLFLSGDAVHVGQQVARPQHDRNPVGLLQPEGVGHALGALGQQLVGRLAQVGIGKLGHVSGLLTTRSRGRPRPPRPCRRRRLRRSGTPAHRRCLPQP